MPTKTAPPATPPVYIQTPVKLLPPASPQLSPPALVSPTMTVTQAQAWLSQLAAAYAALATNVTNAQNNVAADTTNWSADINALGTVITTLEAEQASKVWITDDVIDAVKNAQGDLLTAQMLVGAVDQVFALIVAWHAQLDIAEQAPAVSTLLAQMQTGSPLTVQVGGVKKSTAVLSAVGGVAAGGIAGGLLGHAVGAGLLFAGESLGASEKKRTKKRRRR